MESVTNALIIDSLLDSLKNTEDTSHFKKLLEQLTIQCINLEVNQVDVSEENVGNDIASIKVMEKVSMYLFSEYNNILKSFEKNTMINAMQLCALASEKLGDYYNHISEEKLLTLRYNQIHYKQLKTYWRSSVAYTLSGNPPSSFVVAKKYEQALNKLNTDDILNKDMKNIYIISCYLLSRNFINNIEVYINDDSLVEIYYSLKDFLVNGNFEAADKTNNLLDKLIQEKLLTYSTNAFWSLKYLGICIRNIMEKSIWNNLTDIFSRDYLRQLIKSKPSVMELWPNQLEVTNNYEGYLRNDNIKRTMINFPTSGGKSLLAEFSIIKELEKNATKKCLYIVPTNALVYEVTKRLRERCRRLGYKVSSSLSGYEPDFFGENLSDDNVVVTTPEKLEMIIRNNMSNNMLSTISLIVFDEFHKIQDEQRGWIIEGSIAFLISHTEYSSIKLVLLSAIIDNGATVIHWLDDKGKCSNYIPNDWKPTIKLKGIASCNIMKDNNGRWASVSRKDPSYRVGYRNYRVETKIKYRINGSSREIPLFQFTKYHNRDNTVAADINIKKENFIMGVAQKLKNLGGSLIYFHTKAECEKFVRNYEPFFPERLQISTEVQHLITYINKRLGSDHLLEIGLNKGLVYHHGSLPIDIREALEDFYLKGYINIMVCTTTLVEGVNFPIQNFIHSGRSYPGERTLSTGDFKNIAGRAGRAYHSTLGQIIYIDFWKNLIQDHFNYEEFENYVSSSLLEDNEFFTKLDELETIAEEEQESLLLDLTSSQFSKTLLVFYNSVNSNAEGIEVFLTNTLFAKQANPEKLGKITSFSGKMYYFYDTRPAIELIKVQESGLSFKSYRVIQDLASEIVIKYSALDGVVESVKELISTEMYNQLLLLDESKRFEVRKSTATSHKINIDDYNLTVDWIESSKTLKELSDEYFTGVDQNYRMSRMVEYGRDVFEYKLPWVVGTLCSIVMESVGNVYLFMYLPLFIKYGVNHEVDVNLFKLGLNSRETVKDISSYIQSNTSHRSLDELRNYLKEADPLTFLNEGERITPFEVRKLVTLTNNYKDLTDIFNEYEYNDIRIAGTRYYFCQIPQRDDLLLELENGSILTLRRDSNNFYDENAVEVFFRDTKLGYIPRDVNEEVSYYLNLSNEYTLTVNSVNVVDLNKFIEVNIRLSFETK